MGESLLESGEGTEWHACALTAREDIAPVVDCWNHQVPDGQGGVLLYCGDQLAASISHTEDGGMIVKSGPAVRSFRHAVIELGTTGACP